MLNGNLANWPTTVKAKWPSDTANWPNYDAVMREQSIREQVLEYLARTGMSLAEFSRQTGVSYDTLNKFKHRDGGTSDENGAKLRAYFDKVGFKSASKSDKRAALLKLAQSISEDQLQDALSMLEFLQAKQSQREPQTDN